MKLPTRAVKYTQNSLGFTPLIKALTTVTSIGYSYMHAHAEHEDTCKR